MLMLTHPHEDHAAGMAELANQTPPGIVACVQRFTPVPTDWDLDPETGEDPAATAIFGQKEQALKVLKYMWDEVLDEQHRWDPRAGDEARRLGDIELRCLWPTREAVASFEDGDDPNTLSIVLVATWNKHRLLLGADLLSPQWAQIAKRFPARTS